MQEQPFNILNGTLSYKFIGRGNSGDALSGVMEAKIRQEDELANRER